MIRTFLCDKAVRVARRVSTLDTLRVTNRPVAELRVVDLPSLAMSGGIVHVGSPPENIDQDPANELGNGDQGIEPLVGRDR